jgi:hypothetical protein
MSYSIYIGEEAPDEDDPDATRVYRVESPDAPEFEGDRMTGKGNHRHARYSQWTDFTREAGLYDLFFDKQCGLMREHPDTQRLTVKHLREVERALDDWRRHHPRARPGWGAKQDPILARLVWLQFWVKWTLGNCKRPAIHNH